MTSDDEDHGQQKETHSYLFTFTFLDHAARLLSPKNIPAIPELFQFSQRNHKSSIKAFKASPQIY